MSANLENSIVATGLDKVSFHSNPKGGQCQRLFQLLYNCTHHMIQQFYIQNPSSYVKSVTAFTFSPSICHEVMGLGAMTQFFECSVSSQLFHSPLLPSSRNCLVPLHVLLLEWNHLHIRGYVICSM